MTAPCRLPLPRTPSGGCRSAGEPRTPLPFLLLCRSTVTTPHPHTTPTHRRAYEKHFKEFRHQNGMRALGIPNNKMFYEVTKIEDALQLWKSIQVRRAGPCRSRNTVPQ